MYAAVLTSAIGCYRRKRDFLSLYSKSSSLIELMSFWSSYLRGHVTNFKYESKKSKYIFVLTETRNSVCLKLLCLLVHAPKL